MANFLLAGAALATALIAGLFYAYSCSVNPGLGRLPDREYLAAMQSINKAILNPLFFLSFMGALVLLPASAAFHYREAGSGRFVLLLLAAIVYLAGTFGLTIAGNVPLNNMLERFDIGSASSEAVALTRKRFEGSWNRFHAIRTIASVISLVLVILACMRISFR